MLELISKGQDATAPSYSDGVEYPPMVEVINVQVDGKSNIKEIAEVIKRMRAVAASGRSVVLIPVDVGFDFEWNAESLGLLTTGTPGDTTMTVRYQSKIFIGFNINAALTMF